jgi:hypothetical protein
VDSVPDPLLIRKSASAGNRTRASGSVARNSVHYTTEVVYKLIKYTAHNCILELHIMQFKLHDIVFSIATTTYMMSRRYPKQRESDVI